MSVIKTIGILNGPNMDRLGLREVHLYGDTTLADLEELLKAEAEELGIAIQFFQSNCEGALIDKIGEWEYEKLDGIVINPAGYAHTSVALRDAIAGSHIKFVEVHMTNIHAREKFRHKFLTAPVCTGIVAGLGIEGYRIAVRALS